MENNNMTMYHFLVKKQKKITDEIGTASSLHTESMTICWRTSRLPHSMHHEKASKETITAVSMMQS